MKRMKRFVALFMAVCMLNLSGSFSGLSLVTKAASGDADYYEYSDYVSADASGNGSVSVTITGVKNTTTDIAVPDEYVSGEATYQVTKLLGLKYASGEAKDNKLNVISFSGAIPEIAEDFDVSYYSAKVLKEYASGDAYEKLCQKFGTNKVYEVSRIDNAVMLVTVPTDYKKTFAEVKNAMTVKDLADNADIKGSVSFNFYEDEALTKGLSESSAVVSGKTYYYKATTSGYEDVTGAFTLSADTFTVESGNVTLTCKDISEKTENAEKRAKIVGAQYKNGYALNKADIYNIPKTVKDSTTNTEYKVTSIGANAFVNAYFTSYYIPDSVATIESGAFTADYNDKNALLLRFEATTKEALPSVQGSYNATRFGVVFNSNMAGDDNGRNQITDGWKNEKAGGLSINNRYYVGNPAGDKILFGGKITAADSALYTQHLSDVAISVSDTVDFQTGDAVTVTGGWNNTGYAFSFVDGAKDHDYTYGADGYANQITGKKHITPFCADGFSYDFNNGTLAVSAYDGSKDATGAKTEVTVPVSETDATGAVYAVTGVSGNFSKNWDLKKINLGDNISVIGEGAFNNCKYLEINVTTTNPTLLTVNGFLYSKDMTRLIAAPSANGTTFLPEGIQIIGDYALYNNKRIQTLVIPSTVVKIGESKNARCFQGCDQLETIKFCNSANITTLTFMGSVFGGALKEIYVPVGTTAAYETALKNSGVWYNATIKEWYPTTSNILTLSNFDEVTVTPTDTTKTYTWTSDNTSLVVATPSADTKSAKIHAVNYSGIANVTAVAPDGTSTSWQVTVNIGANLANPYAVDAYTLTTTKTKVTMGVKSGKKVDKAVITVSASNGSAITLTSAKTSKKKVATVSVKGNKVTIKAGKKKGKANITVTDSLGKTAVIAVTVKAAPKKLTLKKKSVTIKKGKTYAIGVKNTASAKLTYKTSKKKIATVTSDGIVKAKKKGTCKITVTTYNGKKATLKVKVKK